MSVNKALNSILEGKLDEMRTEFSNALSTKAVEKLEERKIEIAQAYFGQVQEEVEQIDEAPSKKRMKRELSAAARREEGARDGFGNEDEEKKSAGNYRRIEKKYGKKGINIVNNRADHLLYGKRK